MKLLQESSKTKIINGLTVMFISIYGISQKKFNIEDSSYFHRFFGELASPVQESLSSSKRNVVSLWDNYISIVNTAKQNVVLNKKISRLENDLFNLEEIRKENLRLKQLLSFVEESPQQKILAQVVGWDSSNEFRVIRLNKGKSHGILPMAAVVTDQGLVGYVYRATQNYSDVLTILDQNNRVDVIVERTRTHGVVEGILNFKCILKYVTKNEPVEVGDRLITAGVGGIYPKGVKVGMITDISRENFGMTLNIEVEPAVDFHKLEEVVVLSNPHDRLSDLYQSPIANDVIDADEEVK